MSIVVPGYGGKLAMDIYLTFDAKDKAVMYGRLTRTEGQMCFCCESKRATNE